MNSNLEVIGDELVNKKKKKSIVIPICSILIILILTLLIFLTIKYLFKAPKDFYEEMINTIFRYSEKAIEYSNNESKLLTTPAQINGEISINSNMEGLTEYNDYNLKYNLGIDYLNKKMLLGGSINNKDINIIDISSLIKDSTLYLKSNTMFEDILSLYDEELNEIFNLNNQENQYSSDDIIYILNLFKNGLIESISNDDFLKTKEKININDKDINVSKISYILDSNKENKIANNIREKILNDEKALEILANISNTSIEDIKNILNDEINNQETDTKEINIYTKSNKILKYEFIEKSEYSNSKLEIMCDNNVYTVQMYSNDVLTNKIVIKKENIEKYNIDFYQDDEVICNIILEKTQNKININYKFNYDDTSVYGLLNIENNKKDNGYDSNTKFTININTDGNEQSLEINNTSKLEYVEKIEEFDTSNSINIETLDENYYNNIYENIKNKLINTPFYNLITYFVSPSIQNEYTNDIENYNYDYNYYSNYSYGNNA